MTQPFVGSVAESSSEPQSPFGQLRRALAELKHAVAANPGEHGVPDPTGATSTLTATVGRGVVGVGADGAGQTGGQLWRRTSSSRGRDSA
jgi:hypothetical protein